MSYLQVKDRCPFRVRSQTPDRRMISTTVRVHCIHGVRSPRGGARAFETTQPSRFGFAVTGLIRIAECRETCYCILTRDIPRHARAARAGGLPRSARCRVRSRAPRAPVSSGRRRERSNSRGDPQRWPPRLTTCRLEHLRVTEHVEAAPVPSPLAARSVQHTRQGWCRAEGGDGQQQRDGRSCCTSQSNGSLG